MMNDESLQLIWDALQRPGSDIPWSGLETLAEGVADDPDLIDELFQAYDEASRTVPDRACYTHLYVPAILALAAPRLDERRRQEVGASLIARLIEAGEQDDHLMMEVLVAAAGAMGPVILPRVLDVVTDEAASSGARCHLWGLTKLAVESDQASRSEVVAACIGLLERVAREELECEVGVEAAWTLASLGCVEHVELLRLLELRSRWSLVYTDYSGARRALEEHRGNLFPLEFWELPVRDWFAPRWQRTQDWVAVRDNATRNWETLQASYATPIPIVACAPASARTKSCYAAIRS